MKRVGKFFEFLLIKLTTVLTTEQKKALAAEQELALEGKELKACKKALEGGKSQQEWNDIWSERRPDKTFKLQDAISDSSSSSDGEDQDGSEEEISPTRMFLKGLKDGQAGPSRPQEPKSLPLPESKESKKRKREDAKAKAAAEKTAKQKAVVAKWEQRVDEATQVGDNDKNSKVKKMLSLVSKGVADLKKACKTAEEAFWGSTELAALTSVRDELEDLSVQSELGDVKTKLIEAAKALKAAKALMDQQAC